MSDRQHPVPDAVIEQLAGLVHEAWVEHQRRQGWRYGAQRDEAALRSPNLLPYAELGEPAKELDRVSVRGVLSGLDLLGYRLEPGAPRPKLGSREHVLSQADELIARGRPLPAYDLTRRWLAEDPNDAELVLCNARALRRCGALAPALRALESIQDRADDDGERRGVAAAVHKELFMRARGRDGGPALEHLREAQRLYLEVFEQSGRKHYWHGINAATLALFAGDDAFAHDLARRVLAVCGAEAPADDYWLRATRAEAELVQGQFAAAAEHYRAAVASARDRIGDIASTRRNASLLLDALGADANDRAAVEEALRAPAVVVFAGLTVDRGETLTARFPAGIEGDVRAALDERLALLDGGIGFSGAAPGAEALFVECMLERRPGLANVVLPWPREQFLDTHVRAAGGDWERRVATLLGTEAEQPRVQHLVNASLGVGVDSPLYERFAQQLLFGLARLQAATLGSPVTPLVVWDRGPGDVAEVVALWATQGVVLPPDNVVDLGVLLQRKRQRPKPPGLPAGEGRAAGAAAFRTMAILFADVEDYSSIPEARLPAFIEYFVGGINSRLVLRPYKPANVRRVGDGLLMVFERIRDAGLCALELVDWARGHSEVGGDGETYWSRLGLPRTMRIRVALHAGPVFECIDPLTRAPTFEGAHINYAARIEPVTPGNQVYASEAFAALAASWPDACEEFVCEYVGRTSLAKRFGEYPLYHVRRRA